MDFVCPMLIGQQSANHGVLMQMQHRSNRIWCFTHVVQVTILQMEPLKVVLFLNWF